MINITPGAVDYPQSAGPTADPKPVADLRPININTAPLDLGACAKAASNVAKSGGGLLLGAIVGAVAAFYVPRVLGHVEGMIGGHSDGFETEDGDEYDITVSE